MHGALCQIHRTFLTVYAIWEKERGGAALEVTAGVKFKF